MILRSFGLGTFAVVCAVFLAQSCGGSNSSDGGGGNAGSGGADNGGSGGNSSGGNGGGGAAGGAEGGKGGAAGGSAGASSGGSGGITGGSGGNAMAGASGGVGAGGTAAGGAGGTAMNNNGDTAQYAFEQDAMGWKLGHFESQPAPGGVTISQTTDKFFAGKGSLKLEVDTTGDAAAGVVDHDKWNRAFMFGSTAKVPMGKPVKFHLWIPTEAKIQNVQLINGCLATAGGYKFEVVNAPTTRDAWAEATLTTIAKPPCNLLAEIGVQFFTATGGAKFTAYVDSVSW